MGNCCATAQQFEELRDFSFSIHGGGECSFERRAEFELLMHNAKIKILDAHLKGFLVENVKLIKERGIAMADGGYPAQLIPTPLLDKFWELATLYSERYYYYCATLLGAPIDRDGSLKAAKQVYIQKHREIFPNYNVDLMVIDHKHIVWVLHSQLENLLNGAYEHVKPLFNEPVFLTQREVGPLLLYLRALMQPNYADDEVDEASATEEPHSYIVLKMIHKIEALLPKRLSKIVARKYCMSQQQLLGEYVRFLTIMALSKDQTVIPSEEINWIWQSHASLTREYRKFCESVFGELVHYKPIAFSLEGPCVEQYSKTFEYYQKYFDRRPPENLWPPVIKRFDKKIYNGYWIDLVRLIFATIRAVHMQRFEGSSYDEAQIRKSILNAYLQWQGDNLIGCDIDTSSPLPKWVSQYWVAGVNSYVKVRGFHQGTYSEYEPAMKKRMALSTATNRARVHDEEAMSRQRSLGISPYDHRYLNRIMNFDEDEIE